MDNNGDLLNIDYFFEIPEDFKIKGTGQNRNFSQSQ